MMTGVGLTAEASCAAIRCAIDNFQETRFIASGGEWIIGSEVPLEEPWRGIPRLARLLRPTGECQAGYRIRQDGPSRRSPVMPVTLYPSDALVSVNSRLPVPRHRMLPRWAQLP
jgi:hypothetical protein